MALATRTSTNVPMISLSRLAGIADRGRGAEAAALEIRFGSHPPMRPEVQPYQRGANNGAEQLRGHVKGRAYRNRPYCIAIASVTAGFKMARARRKRPR